MDTNLNFIEELKWRGMLHNMMPGTEEALLKGTTRGYIGFDPTADSLHVGSLLPIMILQRFQACGHKPYALVGGATGMVGDPSGKSQERNLLDYETLQRNIAGIRQQLEKLLDFSDQPNSAVLVNNYDWFKDMGFLTFIRDIGKHITVNYMMAKDSVKNRISGDEREGMSFTEFTYQLVQGYDFYYLWKNHNITIQMGGSDQWGNITTGNELIKRLGDGQVFALTTPLITKPDGSKFGKTEGGNIWLDPKRTSPYHFYQFWLNTPDDAAGKYLRIFTNLTQPQIEALEAQHAQAPHERLMQKNLAQKLTTMVHSQTDYEQALNASAILFGKGVKAQLATLSVTELLDIFSGVPNYNVPRTEFEQGIGVIDLVAQRTHIFESNGEARRSIQNNGLTINKERITTDKTTFTTADLINDRCLLVQKGKKGYFLILAV